MIQHATIPTKVPWYRKASPEIGQAFADFYNTVNEKGVLDGKTRSLLMLAVANLSRCTHCTENGLRKAEESGASRAEIAEALLISALGSGGTQLYWAEDVFERFFNSVPAPSAETHSPSRTRETVRSGR